jgi:hypothetical protein
MKNILFFAILGGLFACSNETELKKSIFLPDRNFPELPEYSEWGYNTFGAYYDRQIFISNEIEVPLKVIQEDNKTSFVFTGQKGLGSYINGPPFTMTLILSGFNPQTYADLIALDNTMIDLTDPNKVSIASRPAADTVEILNGKFHIIRAQYLLVDQNPEEVILSGVFEFQAIIQGTPVTISNGRFDVGVGQYNFYRF